MKFIFILLSLILTLISHAKSVVYVSDQIEIPIRDAIGREGSVIQYALSGEVLELLKSTESGWTQVKTKQGETGWIISRYIMNTPAARHDLPKINNLYNTKNIEHKQLKVKFEQLEKQLSIFQNKHQKTLIEKAKVDTKVEHIKTLYKNSIQIEHKNQQLSSQILQQKSQIQLLEQNNLYQQDRQARNWFILGALVLLFGGIIGGILVKVFNKKQPNNYL